MNGYPRDVFDEMDEIFDHLFARMQEEFMTGGRNDASFRLVIERPDTFRPMQEVPSPRSRVSVNPKTEVHRMDDEVKVIAELPGATPDRIRLEVNNSLLIIDADGIEAPYHTTADLPSVDRDSLQSTFRNGVLEVTLRVMP